jgi:hypothetical protein
MLKVTLSLLCQNFVLGDRIQLEGERDSEECCGKSLDRRSIGDDEAFLSPSLRTLSFAAGLCSYCVDAMEIRSI